MIPTHELSNGEKKQIIIHQLAKLNDYDSTKPHRHDYFELFIFNKGGGNHLIDFENIPIMDYSIHLVAPGKVHQVNRSLDSNGFVILFKPWLFNENIIEQFLLDHTCYSVKEFPPNYSFSDQQNQQLESITTQIWQDYQQESLLNQDFILHNLALLCILCMRKGPTNLQTEINPQVKLYQDFRRLLHKEFYVLKKVTDYAGLLNISEKQLNELVKNNTGKSASSIIYAQQIMEAQRLLNTGMSIKEVAFTLNFTDPSHFSKFFKNQTGQAPSDFIKVHDLD